MQRTELEYIAAVLITAAAEASETLKVFANSEVTRRAQSLRDKLRYSIVLVSAALKTAPGSTQDPDSYTIPTVGEIRYTIKTPRQAETDRAAEQPVPPAMKLELEPSAVGEADAQAALRGEGWKAAQPQPDTWWHNGRRTTYNPCCSSIEPCSHQQRDPYTVCDNCQRAQHAAPDGFPLPTGDGSRDLDRIETYTAQKTQAPADASTVGAKMLVSDHEQSYRELYGKLERMKEKRNKWRKRARTSDEGAQILRNTCINLHKELNETERRINGCQHKVAELAKLRDVASVKAMALEKERDQLRDNTINLVNQREAATTRLLEVGTEFNNMKLERNAAVNELHNVIAERNEAARRAEELKLHETAARLAENTMAGALEKLQAEYAAAVNFKGLPDGDVRNAYQKLTYVHQQLTDAHRKLTTDYAKAYKVGYDDGQSNRVAMPNTVPVPFPDHTPLSSTFDYSPGGFVINSDELPPDSPSFTDDTMPSEMYCICTEEPGKAHVGKLWRGDRKLCPWGLNFIEISPQLWHALARVKVPMERVSVVKHLSRGPYGAMRWRSEPTQHHASVDFTPNDIYAVDGTPRAPAATAEGETSWYNPVTHQLHQQPLGVGRGLLGSNWQEISQSTYRVMDPLTHYKRSYLWADMGGSEPPMTDDMTY